MRGHIGDWPRDPPSDCQKPRPGESGEEGPALTQISELLLLTTGCLQERHLDFTIWALHQISVACKKEKQYFKK